MAIFGVRNFCELRRNHRLKLVSLLSLSILSTAAFANQRCELIDNYNYNRLMLLTTVSQEQAVSIRSVYSTTLAENSVNWALSDTPTASGDYPFFVKYYSSSARKLRTMFANLQMTTGNLRGEGNVRQQNTFISTYKIGSAQQEGMKVLLGDMLDSDKVSIQYEQDSLTMNGYSIYHDLVSTYHCMIK